MNIFSTFDCTNAQWRIALNLLGLLFIFLLTLLCLALKPENALAMDFYRKEERMEINKNNSVNIYNHVREGKEKRLRREWYSTRYYYQNHTKTFTWGPKLIGFDRPKLYSKWFDYGQYYYGTRDLYWNYGMKPGYRAWSNPDGSNHFIFETWSSQAWDTYSVSVLLPPKAHLIRANSPQTGGYVERKSNGQKLLNWTRYHYCGVLNVKGDYYIDTTPPETDNVVSVKSTDVYLYARDTSPYSGGSAGVKCIYYRVDGGTTRNINGSSGHVLLGKGRHTVEYWAIDNDNNRESAETITVTADSLAPAGSISIENGLAATGYQKVNLNLNAWDDSSGVQDMMVADEPGFTGSNWENYGTVKSWVLSAGDGTKTVFVKFRDFAGNISSVYSDSIDLDTICPTGSIQINNGNSLTGLINVTLDIKGTDSGSGILDMMVADDPDFNQRDWEQYAAAKSWELPVFDGAKTVYIKFRDYAGNISPVYSDSIILDTRPPFLSVVKTPEITNNPSLYVTGNIEEGALVTVKHNGLPVNVVLNGKNFSAPVTLSEGNNTIEVIASDPVGNQGTPVYRYVILDTRPPALSVAATPELTNNRSLLITGTAEAGAIVNVISGKSITVEKEGNNFQAHLTLAEGENIIEVVATDAAGNKTRESRTVVLDSIAVLRVDPTPQYTNNSSLSVKGSTEVGATVTINGTSYEGPSFSYHLTLVEGSNEIRFTARDALGNVASEVRTVVLDTILPVFTVDPMPEKVSFVTSLTVTGTVEEGAWVTVNGTRAEGSAFSHTVNLVDGPNEINVTAIDLAGNTCTQIFTVENFQKLSDLVIVPEPIIIGYNTFLQYNLVENDYITISIFKENGELVRTLLNNSYRWVGYNNTYWDCKDKNGVPVSEGNYRITIEAKNQEGEKRGWLEKTVLAVKAPVAASISDNPDPFNPLLGEKSTISYSLKSEALVSVKIFRGYEEIETLNSAERQSPGSYSLTWDGLDGTTPYGDAVYSYQIETASTWNPDFRNIYKYTTTIEKEPPSISDFTCLPDPFKIKSANMSIYYNLSENAKVTLDIVDSDGTTVRTLVGGVSKNAGTNNASWDGKNDAGQFVPEGVYTAVISAVDNFGKSSGEKKISYTAGLQPALINPSASPEPFDPNAGSASISYTLSEEGKVTLEILKGLVPVRTINASQKQPANIRQTLFWDGKDDDGNLVGDGVYNYQITASSPLVPIFKSVYKGNITVEKEAPRVNDLYLGPDPFRLETATPLSIRYNLSENASISIYIYRGADPSPIRNLYVTPESKVGGYLSAYWDGKDDIGAFVEEGNYSVEVKAVDPFGKTGTARGNFTAGYVPAITNVSNDPGVFNPGLGGNATINYTLDHDAKVTVTISNGLYPVRTIQVGNSAKGSHTVIWNGNDDNGQPVPDANYTYRIEAISPTVEMFKSNSTGSIIVEARDPGVSNLYTTPYVMKIGNNASLGYELSEAATVTLQVLKAEGGIVRDFPAVVKTKAGIYTATWDGKNNEGNLIATGDYILKVSVVDSFGKKGMALLPFQAGKAPVISGAAVTPDPYDVSSGEISFSYNISERAYVNVYIFDSTGKLWKTVCYYRDTMPGSATVTWNGVGENGQTVYGTYTYSITANSVIGNFAAQPVTGTFTVSGPT